MVLLHIGILSKPENIYLIATTKRLKQAIRIGFFYMYLYGIVMYSKSPSHRHGLWMLSLYHNIHFLWVIWAFSQHAGLWINLWCAVPCDNVQNEFQSCTQQPQDSISMIFCNIDQEPLMGLSGPLTILWPSAQSLSVQRPECVPFPSPHSPHMWKSTPNTLRPSGAYCSFCTQDFIACKLRSSKRNCTLWMWNLSCCLFARSNYWIYKITVIILFTHYALIYIKS